LQHGVRRRAIFACLLFHMTGKYREIFRRCFRGNSRCSSAVISITEKRPQAFEIHQEIWINMPT
jgi:hypothetical protein